MAEPTQYTSATKTCNPISSSSSLMEALVCIGLFTDLTQFTKAIESNKTHLKCHINQLKQPISGAEEHQGLPQTRRVWGAGDKGFLSCQPWPGHRAQLLQTCPPESNTQGTLWQPPLPAKEKTRGERGHEALTCFLVPSMSRRRWQHFIARSSRVGSCAIRWLPFPHRSFKLKS